MPKQHGEAMTKDRLGAITRKYDNDPWMSEVVAEVRRLWKVEADANRVIRALSKQLAWFNNQLREAERD